MSKVQRDALGNGLFIEYAKEGRRITCRPLGISRLFPAKIDTPVGYEDAEAEALAFAEGIKAAMGGKPKPTKPNRNTATDAQIMAYLTSKWKHHWWGVMDCDRCPNRTGSAPCITCGRWSRLIENYRKRRYVGG